MARIFASCCWEGWRGKLVSGGALSQHHQAFSVHFKNMDSSWSYACAPDTVNVFEGGMMLSGCSKLSLAATMLCQLQLYALWQSSRRELSGQCCTACVTELQTWLWLCVMNGKYFERSQSCLSGYNCEIWRQRLVEMTKFTSDFVINVHCVFSTRGS